MHQPTAGTQELGHQALHGVVHPLVDYPQHQPVIEWTRQETLVALGMGNAG
jgi:hypothetical protein